MKNAVRQIEEQARAMLSTLGQRLGATIKIQHPVVAWLVELAALTLDKYLVGRDGRTTYEKVLGKSCKEEVI